MTLKTAQVAVEELNFGGVDKSTAFLLNDRVGDDVRFLGKGHYC